MSGIKGFAFSASKQLIELQLTRGWFNAAGLTVRALSAVWPYESAAARTVVEHTNKPLRERRFTDFNAALDQFKNIVHGQLPISAAILRAEETHAFVHEVAQHLSAGHINSFKSILVGQESYPDYLRDALTLAINRGAEQLVLARPFDAADVPYALKAIQETPQLQPELRAQMISSFIRGIERGAERLLDQQNGIGFARLAEVLRDGVKSSGLPALPSLFNSVMETAEGRGIIIEDNPQAGEVKIPTPNSRHPIAFRVRFPTL